MTSNLSHHKRAKHGGTRMYCGQCYYSATKSSHLKTHIESVHEGIRYPCDQCEFAATQRSHLKKHKESKHGVGTFFPCNLCQYCASDAKTLNQHIDSEHDVVRYACDQCDFKTLKVKTLRRHRKYNHSEFFSCDKCEFGTNKMLILNQHRLDNHSTKKRKRDRSINFTPKEPASVNHNKSRHDEVLDSEQYDLAALQLYDLKMDRDGMRYYCDQCDFPATKARELSKHKEMEHPLEDIDDPLGEQEDDHLQTSEDSEEEEECYLEQTFIIFDQTKTGKLKL